MERLEDTSLGIMQCSQYPKYFGLCDIKNEIWMGMIYLDLWVGLL